MGKIPGEAEPRRRPKRHSGMRECRFRLAPGPFRRVAALISVALVGALLTGCALFQTSAQVGPDLRPRVGADVSIPFGR